MKYILSFADSMKAVGIPIVKMQVNGHDGFFMVDTGSTGCHIDEGFAKEIGAEEIQSSTKNTISLGGRTAVTNTYYLTFTFGEWELSEVKCTSSSMRVAQEHLLKKGIRMDGIIGVPMLSFLQAEINLNNFVLILNMPDMTEETEVKNQR